MSALHAASRFRITARRAKKAAESNPLTSALIGATVAGGLLLAHSLYTEEPDTCDTSAREKMSEAEELDLRQDLKIEEMTQEKFEKLMGNWTKAAALYSEAAKRKCHEAQYALGRLCYEGRGYVYDPKYGTKLYEQAAIAGNKEAMRALAHIALDQAQLGYFTTVRTRGELDKLGHDPKTHSLYEAASLLRRALGRKDALTALSDFKPFDSATPNKAWTSTWKKDTYDFLEHAATKSPVALSQQRRIGMDSWIQFPNWPAEIEVREWRENVFSLTVPTFTVSTSSVKPDALITLLDEASASGDAHRMESTAAAVLKYCENVGVDKRIEDTKAKAEELIDAAADAGDVDAIKKKAGLLSKQKWDTLLSTENGNKTEEKLDAEIESLLTRGISGSRECLHELGMHIRFMRDREEEAQDAFRTAAELGHWEAMIDYRTSLSGNNPLHLIESGILVLPIPAVLVNRANTQSQVRLPEVTWPYVHSLSKADALREIKEKLKKICENYTNGDVVILEPIDTKFLGTHDPYYITASAIMESERRGVSIALCVFDDLSVVTSYDRAFDTASRAQNEPSGFTDFDRSLIDIDECLLSRISTLNSRGSK